MTDEDRNATQAGIDEAARHVSQRMEVAACLGSAGLNAYTAAAEHEADGDPEMAAAWRAAGAIIIQQANVTTALAGDLHGYMQVIARALGEGDAE